MIKYDKNTIFSPINLRSLFSEKAIEILYNVMFCDGFILMNNIFFNIIFYY